MNNEKHSGKKLIGELLATPEKFYKQGKAYQLLQEYFNGMSIDTLRPLLRHSDKHVRAAAVFVASELGDKVNRLIDEMVLLLGDPDPSIQWDALESVMVCSTGDSIEHFFFVIKELENNHDSICRLAMRLVSNAHLSQLETGFKLNLTFGLSDKLHRQGLLALLKGESITESEITAMLKNAEPLIRKYGAIAAKRLFSTHPHFLELASTNVDSDISRFSAEALDMLG